jgi:tetratricopeptide (TPR) repeat protein
MLAGFFDQPWRQPVAGLEPDYHSGVLFEAGRCLMALGRLGEAAEAHQVALEAAIEQENWYLASWTAGELSEVHLIGGDIDQALDFARQAVDLADRSGRRGVRMGKRSSLADVLHQAGRLKEASTIFGEAETLQKEDQPQFPLLHQAWGYYYCDLLLGQGKVGEVQRRASQSLEWVQAEGWVLHIALDHLSLGRAGLLQAQQESTGDYAQAAAHLNQALDGLRKAEQQHYLPLGLLARAALHRLQRDFGRAERDVQQALTIAARGTMRLHEADAHLEFARLHLAMGERAKARASLARAKAMIEEMGYGRRDGEVEELEREMGA